MHFPEGSTLQCEANFDTKIERGTITHTDFGTQLDICRFGAKAPLKISEPIFALTEHLDTISLYDSFEVFSQARTRSQFNHAGVQFSRIMSNLSLIGEGRWTEKMTIRRIAFDLPETRILLNHRTTGATGINNDDIFTLSSAGLTTRAYCTVSASHSGAEVVEVPRIEMEFDRGQSIHSISEHVFLLVSFFSISLGRRIKPARIGISHITREQETPQAAARDYFFYVMGEWQFEQLQPDQHQNYSSPFLSFDQEELNALTRSLTAWISRRQDWMKAYGNMFSCLAKSQEVSGERLLSAFKWFENLPNARPEASLEAAQLNEIVEAASNVAARIDPSLNDRIKSSLSKIANETFRSQVERLVSLAWKKTSAPINPELIVRHIVRGRRLRGDAAHSVLDVSGKDSFKDCNGAILALEATCFMLTLADLTVTNDGLNRIWHHRIIRDLRLGEL
ncbi:hypothetical protein ACVDG3_12300 [Meridianimarinicoccus sp. RP-17]|uniref:hypothetical protein n=1 Tax=Meridianimarinicoccus zhengii TaxID=2056810 RepID=UPI0013A68D03|nr:hypothetical protein [Phycocomes zhengii]